MNQMFVFSTHVSRISVRLLKVLLGQNISRCHRVLWETVQGIHVSFIQCDYSFNLENNQQTNPQ